MKWFGLVLLEGNTIDTNIGIADCLICDWRSVVRCHVRFFYWRFKGYKTDLSPLDSYHSDLEVR